MQLPLTLTLLASYAGIATAIYLPAGVWEGSVLANGSYLFKPAGAPDSERFIVLPTVEERSTGTLATRQSAWGGDCFPRDLNHQGCDGAVQGLKNWAGNGRTLTSGNSNALVSVDTRGAMAYYCIDAPHSSGNLDTVDINYALEKMDANCVPYQASYFKWPGSVEIVGKDVLGANICV
ncbi:hypothetical protein GE09DRAFT_1229265 [Coniochaeta sp. 2T2.1]|nr:hypothetical protein GE09DRAFT_1229265 [Coniochaeta sp. 2T2.1]